MSNILHLISYTAYCECGSTATHDLPFSSSVLWSHAFFLQVFSWAGKPEPVLPLQPSSTLRGEKAKAGDTACRVYLKMFVFRPQKGWAVVMLPLSKSYIFWIEFLCSCGLAGFFLFVCLFVLFCFVFAIVMNLYLITWYFIYAYLYICIYIYIYIHFHMQCELRCIVSDKCFPWASANE